MFKPPCPDCGRILQPSDIVRAPDGTKRVVYRCENCATREQPPKPIRPDRVTSRAFRTNIVTAVGVCVAALGAFLLLGADSLATQWQSTGDGGRAGWTDPALRQSYQWFGLIALCFGAVLLGMAAWHWLSGERDAPRLTTH